jgi:NADPH:quinone reductase-like Zn-dependent oxidoreductase
LQIFYSRYFLAGSEEKLAFCKSIGADVGINYKTEDFVARVKEETGGQGITITDMKHDVNSKHSSTLYDLYCTNSYLVF